MREAAEVYCNCMEGEVAACQEGLDFMACEEIEKRKGKSKYKKGKIQALSLYILNENEWKKL